MISKYAKILWENGFKVALFRWYQLRPIQKNKIVFRSYHGTKYNDSPMYISEKLALFAKERGLNIDIVWITDGSISVPEGIRTVVQGSSQAIYELATAKVWVDNVRKDIWDRKRSDQYYIQTWHGGTALKKIERDADGKLSRAYIWRAQQDSKMADSFISCSKWNTEMYKRAFWYEGSIFEYGSPRSDIFYTDPQTAYVKVRKYFHLKEDERFLLYAPTFRNSETLDCYNIEYERLIQSLEAKWGGNWKVIVRLHPNLAKKQNDIVYSEKVLNGSSFPDINELIIASDFLITDYSSCMFDAMEAGKKVIIYATDIDEYMTERGTYFAIEELPFPVTINNQELSVCVGAFDEFSYKNNIRQFMEKLGFVNDGNASQRCVMLILKQMGLT